MSDLIDKKIYEITLQFPPKVLLLQICIQIKYHRFHDRWEENDKINLEKTVDQGL